MPAMGSRPAHAGGRGGVNAEVRAGREARGRLMMGFLLSGMHTPGALYALLAETIDPFRRCLK